MAAKGGSIESITVLGKEFTIVEDKNQIKFSDIVFNNARCTCPACNKTTAVHSEEIHDGVIQCFHCDTIIPIVKD